MGESELGISFEHGCNALRHVRAVLQIARDEMVECGGPRLRTGGNDQAVRIAPHYSAPPVTRVGQ